MTVTVVNKSNKFEENSKKLFLGNLHLIFFPEPKHNLKVNIPHPKTQKKYQNTKLEKWLSMI